MLKSERVPIHSEADFECMREAGRLVAACLDTVGESVREGITTGELDRICETFIRDNGAIPATLGYKGFTKSSCISLNDVICHGIPGSRVLREGDILNIDTTVILDGWHGDSSRMFGVGNLKPAARRVIDVVYRALEVGIAAARPGGHIGDIGAAIERYAKSQRCSVVKEYCGHGIGRVFHDSPQILHHGKPGQGARILPGMFFTIEPMVNLGRANTRVLADKWTVVTRDRSLSAQCEHTMGVTKNGIEVFTESPAGSFHPFRTAGGQSAQLAS